MKSSNLVVAVLAGFGILAILVPIVAFIGLVTWVGAQASRPSPVPPMSPMPMGIPPIAQDLELQAQDYAQARQGFQTKLLRAGPSPQPVDVPARIPPGTQVIPYTPAGLSLTAYVDSPPADGSRRPAVLFLHGGYAFGADDLEMPQPYRDAGYIVMVPILRGENGQPGNFTLYFDEVQDVLAAADALAALPYVDPENLFVAGHSAGGTLAQLAAMVDTRFRAAASLSGACNQHLQAPVWIPFDTSDPAEFELRSPQAYATSFKIPVRLYYGSQEPWIVSTTVSTVQRAQGAGLNVDQQQVPGDHLSAVPESIRRSLEFFKPLRK